MTLDDRGVHPLTTRERRILARLERSLTGGPVPSDPDLVDPGAVGPGAVGPGAVGPGTSGPGTSDRGTSDRGTSGPGTTDPGTDTAAMHRADRVAAVIGLLILCGMTAEAAYAGGPVLGIAVGAAFLLMVLSLVLVVRHRH